MVDFENGHAVAMYYPLKRMENSNIIGNRCLSMDTCVSNIGNVFR
jgi:hypothetical protein